MNFASISEFFAMGGYGLYVWGSLGMCAAVIAAELLGLRARRRALHAEADSVGITLIQERSA